MRTLLLMATLILPSCMWISIPTFSYGAELEIINPEEFLD